MVALRPDQVTLVKLHIELMRAEIRMLNNYGVIKNTRAARFEICLGDIEKLMNGEELDITLPGNAGEGESNSLQKESGLHDGPNG